MKKTLFTAFTVSVFALLSLIYEISVADSWNRFDTWASPNEMRTKNKELRAQHDKVSKESESIRKVEEEAAPKRKEADRRRDMFGITVSASPKKTDAQVYLEERQQLERRFSAGLVVELKDPDSAKFFGVTRKSDGSICGYVNAKNSYGAYSGYSLMCVDKTESNYPSFSN